MPRPKNRASHVLKLGDLRNMHLTLGGLNWAFKWEARLVSLIVPPVFALYSLNLVEQAYTMGAIVCCIVVVLDLTFSALVTYLFLEPIFEVLRMVVFVKNKQKSYLRVQASKYLTMSGTIFVALSSVLLYTNFFLYALRQEKVTSGYLTNPFTFGFYVCSALNTFGILLVCGWAKQFMEGAWSTTRRALHSRGHSRNIFRRLRGKPTKRRKSSRPRRHSFVPNSRAYDEDDD